MSKAPKVCVIPPSGLQGLLMANALIHELAKSHAVLVALDTCGLPVVQRLFEGTHVRFWCDDPSPEAHAQALGYTTLKLPADGIAMYARAKLQPSVMWTQWQAFRDDAAEQDIVDAVIDTHGPSFVLVCDNSHDRHLPRIDASLLPEGLPQVDVHGIKVRNPLDLCGLIKHALQVHAVDGWFLTLADVLGGGPRKFCHAYASRASTLACRTRYSRRVTVIDVHPRPSKPPKLSKP